MKHLWIVLAAACGSAKTSKHDHDDAAVAAEKRPPVALSSVPHTASQAMNMHPVHLDEPVIELPRQDAFELVSPGAAPRAVVKYALATASATYAAETKLRTRHVGADSAWTKPVAIPTIHDGFAIAVEPTNLELRPLPVELAGPATPDTDQYTAGWTAHLANHRANAKVDARGQITKLFFNDDPNGVAAKTAPEAKDELAQRLLATVVPLPDKPIGAGATWRVVTILRQGHAFVKQTATYKLASPPSAAGPWKIDVDIRRLAEEQRIEDARLPAGTYVDLVALVHTMVGTLAIEPARPIGTGTLTVSSQLHARVVGAKTGTIEQLVEDTGTVTLSTTTP